MIDKNESIFCCCVCGLRQIEPPWGLDNKSPTFFICPCCGVEFGYEDCNIETTRSYRNRWLKNGTEWFQPKKMPVTWSVEEQMKNIPHEYL